MLWRKTPAVSDHYSLTPNRTSTQVIFANRTQVPTMSASDHPICDSRPTGPTESVMLTKDKAELALNDDELPVCRICHCSDESEIITMVATDQTGQGSDISEVGVCPATAPTSSLITPCFCSGSLRYVHHYCLQQWIRSSNHKYCELCKYHFKLTVKSKPLHKWESLDMSGSERRKLVCNLVFNMISMFCVFWSIYVLIERATVEARYGMLDWPFWTKMLVVTIGFLGGTIFLFVQLRLYVSILVRWRQFNRIIIIENAPAKDLKNSQQSMTTNSTSISTISSGHLNK